MKWWKVPLLIFPSTFLVHLFLPFTVVAAVSGCFLSLALHFAVVDIPLLVLLLPLLLLLLQLFLLVMVVEFVRVPCSCGGSASDDLMLLDAFVLMGVVLISVGGSNCDCQLLVEAAKICAVNIAFNLFFIILSKFLFTITMYPLCPSIFFSFTSLMSVSVSMEIDAPSESIFKVL